MDVLSIGVARLTLLSASVFTLMDALKDIPGTAKVAAEYLSELVRMLQG